MLYILHVIDLPMLPFTYLTYLTFTSRNMRVDDAQTFQYNIQPNDALYFTYNTLADAHYFVFINRLPINCFFVRTCQCTYFHT